MVVAADPKGPAAANAAFSRSMRRSRAAFDSVRGRKGKEYFRDEKLKGERKGKGCLRVVKLRLCPRPPTSNTTPAA